MAAYQRHDGRDFEVRIMPRGETIRYRYRDRAPWVLMWSSLFWIEGRSVEIGIDREMKER